MYGSYHMEHVLCMVTTMSGNYQTGNQSQTCSGCHGAANQQVELKKSQWASCSKGQVNEWLNFNSLVAGWWFTDWSHTLYILISSTLEHTT